MRGTVEREDSCGHHNYRSKCERIVQSVRNRTVVRRVGHRFVVATMQHVSLFFIMTAQKLDLSVAGDRVTNF